MGKGFEQMFLKAQVTDMHKGCSVVSLQRNQIKATMKYHFPPVQTATAKKKKKKKRCTVKSVEKNVDKSEPRMLRAGI